MDLNELSKDLLRRYVKAGDRRQDYNLGRTLQHYDNAKLARDHGNKRWHDQEIAKAKKLTAQHRKRDNYLNKADAKIAEETQLSELSAGILSKYLIKAVDDKRHKGHKKDISTAFQKWLQQKEEREALAELSSKSTLSYFNKACFSRSEAEKNGDVNTMKKRERGAFRAIDSIAKKEGLRSKPKRSLMKVKRYAAGTSFEESTER